MWNEFSVPELGTKLSPRVLWGLAALLVLLHLGLGSVAREIGLHVVRDDARYILLSRSLASLEYRDLYLVGTPVHTLYPPLYPLLLLAWGIVFGESFGAFTMLGVILSTAALWITFAALKRITSPGVALICLAALAVNPFLVARAGSVRSEVPYMVLSLLALWLLAGDLRSVRTDSPSGRAGALGTVLVSGRQGAVAAGLVIAAAILTTLTRANGVTLIAAIGLTWLLARRYRALTVLAVASMVTVGVWLAWSALSATSLPESSYLQDVARTGPGEGDLLDVLWRRTGYRAWRVFAQSVPWMLPLPAIDGTPVDNLLMTGIGSLSLVAGSVLLIRRWTAAGLYLLIYLASLFAWPFLRGRFIEVILPLLVPAVLLGSAALAGVLRSSWRTPALVTAALLLTATGSVKTAGLVRQRMDCEPFVLADPPACLTDEQRSLLVALHEISEKAAPDAIFVSTMPEPIYYHTSRKSISWQAAQRVPEDDILEYLREQGVNWVLLTSASRRISARLLPHCDELVLEQIFPPRTYLLRIPGPDEAPTPGSACRALAKHLDQSTTG
jgi:hypothetical protein